MSRIKEWFSKQKLEFKFNFAIGTIVFIPLCLFMMLYFYNFSKNLRTQTENQLRISMSQNLGTIQKSIDMCNTSTQVLLGYENLKNFLSRLKAGAMINTSELIEFNNDEISMLERMVTSNPYLYQIRVYAENDSFSEMVPILYRYKRLEEFSFESEYKSGDWQFNYEDVIHHRSVNPSNHTMGLFTDILDYNKERIGVIEISVRMENVFTEIFNGSNKEWSCFIDRDGKVYSLSEEKNCKWEVNKEAVVNEIGQDEGYYKKNIMGSNVVVGVMPISELSGTLVKVISIEEESRILYISLFQYFAIMMVCFVY